VIPGLIDTRLPAYGGAVELLDHGVTGVFEFSVAATAVVNRRRRPGT